MKFKTPVALLYLKQFFLGRLEYPLDFFASILSSFVSAGMGIVFLLFLFHGAEIQELAGWSKYQVLFIYGYAAFATSLFSILSPNLYQFGDRYIIQGQFDRVLLRPLSTLQQVMTETFNLEALGNLLVGLLTLSVAKYRLDIHFSALDWLWLIFSGLCGAIILLSVFVILASLSFHFEDRLGIAPPFYNMITFGRYPLNIFNRVLQFILSWIIPFGFVAFFPASYFFPESGLGHFYLLTPVIAALFALLAAGFWRVGVRAYESTGN